MKFDELQSADLQTAVALMSIDVRGLDIYLRYFSFDWLSVEMLCGYQ